MVHYKILAGKGVVRFGKMMFPPQEKSGSECITWQVKAFQVAFLILFNRNCFYNT